jgi:hypothetical protein
MNAQIDHVAWARRLNGRWIVHGQLNGTTAAYMDYLAETDPERLARSCRLAHHLVRTLRPAEDPKPWFYGGIFSLATATEAARFLDQHALIASVVPALASGSRLSPGLGAIDPTTRRKILRLRNVLRRMTHELHE